MKPHILAALLLAAAPAAAQTQTPGLSYGWAPKPVSAPFVAPNRAHWKLADLLKAHAAQKSWSQTLVRDPDGLTGRYIQTAPGEVSHGVMYSNGTMFFIVQSGQLRVTIDGVEPFIAAKGFIVQVPSLRAFHVETAGDEPALRFEVTHTRSLPIDVTDEPPAAQPGVKYVKVSYYSAASGYDGKKPYVDYQKDIAQGGMPGSGLVQDDFIAANVSRGMAVPRPPDSDKGHFHVGTSEFWFVMEGKVDYLIEGVPFFTASQGDIVYAPAGRWHRASFGGDGMASRVSIHPVGSALNALEPEQH